MPPLPSCWPRTYFPARSVPEGGGGMDGRAMELGRWRGSPPSYPRLGGDAMSAIRRVASAFAGLLFPWFARFSLRARPSGTPREVSEFDVDFAIIGSGFGGSVSALRLTEKGYRVAVIEMG